MDIKRNSLVLSIAALGAYIPSSIAFAQDFSGKSQKLFAQVVPAETLAQQRGGSETQVLNLMNLDGKLNNNVARANVSGDNIVTQGAFTNANGFSTVIQNSGNNVLIQNATILNLDLK